MTGNTFSPARLALLVFLAGMHVPLLAGGAALEASDSTVSGPTLALRLGKDRAYPGEDIEVTVTLVVGQAPLRNVQYPTLAGTGYRLSEFGPPRQKALEHEGRTLDAQEFVARLTPFRSGDYQVGPATLKAEVLLPGSGAAAFFGNNEPTPLKLESPSANLHVLPLPREGRPAGFTGAIGRFTLDRQVNPGEVQRGDPLTVTTVIRGEGNIEAFACPKLEPQGVRSYPPRSRRTAESLSCEQVLVAEAASGLTVPATAISFFDPRTGRYQMVSADAVQVPVRPPRVAEPATLASALSKQDTRPNQAVTDRMSFYAWAALLCTGLLMGLGIYGWMRKRPVADVAQTEHANAHAPARDWLAEARDALVAEDPERFHRAAYRALQGHLGASVGLAPGGITGDIVDRVLRDVGLEEPLLGQYKTLFNTCDRERYALHADRRGGLDETYRLLQEVVGKG